LMESPAAPEHLDIGTDGIPNSGLFPRRVTIELSAACNLSCIMCPRQYGSLSDGFMKRALFEKIVEELSAHDVDAVVPFFRGEPLLHPDFLDMIILLREKTQARIQLATNGLLLTPFLARALLNVGIDFISFSMDALTEETYKKIRAGGDFHRLMDNVHMFIRMRKDMEECVTSIQVSATEVADNEYEIPAFIRYWEDRADRVRIYPCHSDGGRYGRLLRPAHCMPDVLRKPCRKPFTDLVIYADGRVALCNHDWDRGQAESLGDVQKESIERVWKSRPYEDIRGRHLDGRWDELVPCRECDHWQAWDSPESAVGLVIQR
jgi:radical SAM protein with 4Fe4S-binding SPASM domain